MNTEYKKIGETLEVGDYVKAINECHMGEGIDEKTLTIGKLYKITLVTYHNFDVIDDEGDAHVFYFKDGGEFFERIDGTSDLIDETIEKMVEKYRQDLYNLLKINKG